MAEENTVEDGRELDVNTILDYREEYEDDVIIDNLVSTLDGSILDVNGNLLDIKGALDSGMSATQLLDYVVTGKEVRDVGPLSAAMQGVNTGLTNFIGMPVDMTNMALQGLEGLGRAGINKLGGDVSTNPNDFLFSSPNPVGGGQSVRDTVETVVNPIYDAVGANEIDYADSADEFEGINKSLFKGGEIIGENAPIVTGATLYSLIKEGGEKAAKVLTGESAATAGGSAAVATLSELSDGEANPVLEMGAEFIGNIAGRNPSAIYTGVKTIGGPAVRQLKARFGKGTDEGYQELLRSLKTAEQRLLSEADLAERNNDTARATALREEAKLYTPEVILQNMDEAAANQKDLSEAGVSPNNLPAGSVSNNPALAAVQRALQSDTEFDVEVKKRISDAISGLLQSSDTLARGNNPIAAEAIAQNAYQKAIATAVFMANKEALRNFDGITAGASIDAASTKAQKVLFEAKDNWRATETALWDRIPKNVTVSGQQLAATVRDVIDNRLLPGMSLTDDPQLNNSINALLNQESIQIGDLLKLRSILLNDARTAVANNQFRQAGILDLLADATLNELDDIGGDVGEVVGQARGFSRALNEQFSRYWNKRVLGMSSTGGTNIRSQDVLPTGFGSGGRDARINFDEMQEAAAQSDTKAGPLGEAAEAEAVRKGEELNASSLADDGVRSNVPAATADGPFDPNTSQTMPTDDDIIPEVQVKGRGRMVNKDGSYFDVPSDPDNPIPEYTVYDRVRGQKRPDPEIISDEEFIDGASDFYDPNNNAGTNSPTGVAIRDEGTRIQLGAEMSEAQESFLRAKVMTFKGIDNKIDLQAVEKFYADNAELIQRFPDLKADMDVMVDAQRIAEDMADDLNYAAETGQLPDAIIDAVNNNPTDGYARLATEAKSVEQVVDFRNATIDAVVKRSRNADGEIDVFKLADELLTPRSGRDGQDTSLITLMRESNIISAKEQNAIGIALAEAIRIEKSKMSPDQFSEVIKGLPDMAGNLARIAGANLGVLFGRGDASLQAAAIGSQFIKNQFDKFPNLNKKAALVELFKQPDVLRGMLSENPKLRRTTGQAVKDYFTYYSDKGFFGGTTAAVGDAVKATARATARGLQNQPFSTRVGPFTGGTENEENPSVFAVDREMMELGIQ